ncbi:hypothetical protein [Ileibacterium valens]|uniref:hypothetical protein n=1 Tax=Ileibacterium valens TaxID=1862668 RepID=UPI0023538FA4|nr:hypothetical protein [Ileibacterium valens]
MQYLTGIHALNLNCDLGTPGDWHQSGIRWDVVPGRIREFKNLRKNTTSSGIPRLTKK